MIEGGIRTAFFLLTFILSGVNFYVNRGGIGRRECCISRASVQLLRFGRY